MEVLQLRREKHPGIWEPRNHKVTVHNKPHTRDLLRRKNPAEELACAWVRSFIWGFFGGGFFLGVN